VTERFADDRDHSSRIVVSVAKISPATSGSRAGRWYRLWIAPDRKRFAVLTQPETVGGEKGSVHVTMLLN